ncbi:MAG TPA: cation transporter [Acidimicrobiales bacterium]|nr:cation transporter [Acidimicrobiales bacterium]
MSSSARPPTVADLVVRRGRRLQWATVAWNVGEVGVTVALGLAAGSLALIGFGLDSLVEVFASLVVVWYLGGPGRDRSDRDSRALHLVATAFAVLAVYLMAASLRSLVLGERAGSSPAGIAYLAATAVAMFWLAVVKRRVGRTLKSSPFLSEARMTFLDGCLATGILVALALNWSLGWYWADPLAAMVVGCMAGREAVSTWRQAGRVEAPPPG